MSRVVNTYLSQTNTSVPGTVTVYTNSSGAPQVVRVWDWSLNVASLHNVAAAAGMNGSWAIAGLVIGTVYAGTGSTGGQNANSVSTSCGGKEFLLPNGGLITLANAGFTAFQYSHLTVCCDIGIATP